MKPAAKSRWNRVGQCFQPARVAQPRVVCALRGAPPTASERCCQEFNRWFLGEENYKIVLADSGKPVDFKAAALRIVGMSYSSTDSNYIGEFPRAAMSYGFPKTSDKSPY